ncbi:hypothetical protein [Burkholderia sp. Ac-20365]|uniref:hypothetical protein n=1 Tax=Burkholderia sp. Ac-20365 TaxID=2703897 RepID=UPI00197B2E77|nr:hypothetical protein [Burkholderia sp. Ac-20365]MBN3761337.1 hypothetical protein [Burkholderia sp. Ac-20365]
MNSKHERKARVVLDVVGKRFAHIHSDATDGIAGFYDRRKRGILFLKPTKEPFAFAVANDEQGHFFVTCSRHGAGLRYMHATCSVDEKILGIDGLSSSEQRELVKNLLLQFEPPKQEVNGGRADAEGGAVAPQVACFRPLSWVVVELHGKRKLGIVMSDIDVHGEVRTYVSGNAYDLHETQIVVRDVARERITDATSLQPEDLDYEEAKVRNIGQDAGFGPLTLTNAVHHNSWRPASGHPGGWRVVRGIQVQQLEREDGELTLFKSHTPAASVAMMMNATIASELESPALARFR